MALKRSYTAVVERNVQWSGAFTTEPYEVAWASEAIFFIRALDMNGERPINAQVQISPDGIHWVDEGTTCTLPQQPDEVAFCKVSHFGGWLRVSGTLPDNQTITVIVYLTLKE